MINRSGLKEIIEKNPSKNGRLLNILHDIQSQYNYLPEEVIRLIAAELDLPLSRLYGMVTFYNSFSLQPRGKHTIGVCHGTVCHVKGAAKISHALENALDVKVGGTTKDGSYTLESVRCLGCCSLAPVVSVDGVIHAKVKHESAINLVKSTRSGGVINNET